MRQAKKILTVPENGQISIGKKWAGREIMVETVDDNQIVITSGSFVPANHATFYTKEAGSTLKEFDRWSEKTPPQKTDLTQLRKRLGRK